MDWQEIPFQVTIPPVEKVDGLGIDSNGLHVVERLDENVEV